MKAKLMIIGLLSLASTIINASAPPNRCIFVNDGTESNVSFQYFDHSGDSIVSSGQSWGGVTVSSDVVNGDQESDVTISAGRHKTSAVTDWFKNGLKGNNVINSNGEEGAPGWLNFAIKGILILP